MRRRLTTALVILGVVAALGAAQVQVGQPAQPGAAAQALLEAARKVEKIDGKPQEAIKLYQAIVDRFGKTDRPAASTALLRIAECHRLLADTQAHATFERVVLEYPDQQGAVSSAQLALGEMSASADGSIVSRDVSPRMQGSNVAAQAVAPDGKSIAAILMAGGGPRTEYTLVRRSLETGQDQVLTALRGRGTIRWSPTAKHVAVLVLLNQPGPGPLDPAHEELVVVDLTKPGGSVTVVPGLTLLREDVPKILANDTPWVARTAWSADGMSIAYLGPSLTPHTFDCRVIDVTSGKSRSLGVSVEEKPDFRWSPRGDLAFHVTSTANHRDDLYVVKAGSAEPRILPLPPATTDASFAAATTRLAHWTTNGEVVLAQLATPGRWVVSLWAVDNGRLTTACEGASPYLVSGVTMSWVGKGGGPDQCLQIANDGKSEIIWRSASKRLVVHDVGSGLDRNLTTGSGEEDYGFLSPDNRTVIFASDRDRTWGLYAVPLGAEPVAHPILLAKLDGPPRSINLDWTADGFIAQWSVMERPVFRVAVDPSSGQARGGAERLTQDSLESLMPAVSPDNRRIAYFAVTGSKSGLAVMDADGSNERLISELRIGTFPPKPAWRSADEVVVAPWKLGPAGAQTLDFRTINVDTGDTKVAFTRSDVFVFEGEYLKRTDEAVYIADRREGEAAQVVRAVSIATGAARDLLRLDDEKGRLVSIRLTPDGRRMAYLIQTPNMVEAELGIINLEDGQRTTLATKTRDMSIAAWSPDGRFLLYGLYSPNAPLVIDTAAVTPTSPVGAEPHSVPLFAGPSQLPGWIVGSGSWTPNGGFIVASQSDATGDWRQWRGATSDVIARLARQPR